MRKSLLDGIYQHLTEASVSSLLWVSSHSDEMPDTIKGMHCLVDGGALSRIPEEHFDFAVLSNLGDNLTIEQAEALIASMRDVYAQRVFWVVKADEQWSQNDVLALGFHNLEQAEDEVLYGFDIDNYKTTPDWLNSKNWANPERWDKERW